jgi:hypothetical protein
MNPDNHPLVQNRKELWKGVGRETCGNDLVLTFLYPVVTQGEDGCRKTRPGSDPTQE